MLKNSQILPIFGLGLILSTSPLFTLLDSSIVSPETVKLEGQEEGEVGKVAEDTESSSVTSTEPTEETLPKEPSLESSTTTDESQEKEDSSETSTTEEDTHSKEDSPKPEEPLTSTDGSSSQQQELKDSTEDTTSEIKETTESTPSLPQVTVSTTSDATTTTESSPTSTSTEPFKVASNAPSSPTLKTSEVSSTTPTNKASKPSSNTPKTSKSTDSQKQGRKRREYVKDYTGNVKTKNSGVYSVTFTNGGNKYLYSHDGKLSFSLPQKLDQKNFQKISVDNIHISLFKTTAWSSTRSVDEYEEISKENLKDLFSLVGNDKDKKEKKLRQLLVSLSNRRAWIYHKDSTTYNSELKTAEIIWKNDKVKEKNELEIKIKYFLDYKELKEYVEEKLEKCSSQEKGACLASPDELTIIDQDKKSFFTDSKKK